MTLINILKAQIEKMGSMKDQMNNLSREMKNYKNNPNKCERGKPQYEVKETLNDYSWLDLA